MNIKPTRTKYERDAYVSVSPLVDLLCYCSQVEVLRMFRLLSPYTCVSFPWKEAQRSYSVGLTTFWRHYYTAKALLLCLQTRFSDSALIFSLPSICFVFVLKMYPFFGDGYLLCSTYTRIYGEYYENYDGILESIYAEYF